MAAEPTDAERYPGLEAHGAAMLQFLREHPHAPLWRNRSGHRLLPSELPGLRAFEAEVRAARVQLDDGGGGLPDWLPPFVRQVCAEVPAWRALGPPPARFTDLPTLCRADLSRDIARFVPDSVALDRLINFSTSGTSGHPLLIPSHPLVAARYRAFYESALRRAGIELQAGRGAVGVALLGWQRKCFTYVSVTPTREQSGLAKINLHPDDWRDPADRARYLDGIAAEIYSGDPLAYAALLELPTRHRPRALLSTSMALLPGLRSTLEARFQAPVLDLYSLNEAGPVAVFDPALDGHVLLQPRLYVEILDPHADRVLPAGARGEIVLSGGFNFCLPLLRYRSGDFAALRQQGGDWLLHGLEGRPPVRYRRADDSSFNNVELTHALKPLGLPQWQLHQHADGRVRVRAKRALGVDAGAIEAAVAAVFGPGVAVGVELLDVLGANVGDKVVQYTSER